MFYKKSKDVSYTQMCIYIDENVYRENLTTEEKETIYKYIYFISHMLALKMHLFNDYKYYDEFALWYTTQIFFRLQNKKQFEVDSNGQPKMEKIKSILNYIKSTIAGRKVTFEQQEYSQIITQEDKTDCVGNNYSLSDMINESLDELYKVEFDINLNHCCDSIKKFISKIPYKQDSDIYYNIYLSCLLSFLNSVTLSNKDINRINNLKFKENVDFIGLYSKENEDPVILYHLPQSMHDYILVLLREIKHEIAIELSQSCHSYIGTNSGLYILMMQELNNSGKMDYGDNS